MTSLAQKGMAGKGNGRELAHAALSRARKCGETKSLAPTPTQPSTVDDRGENGAALCFIAAEIDRSQFTADLRPDVWRLDRETEKIFDNGQIMRAAETLYRERSIELGKGYVNG